MEAFKASGQWRRCKRGHRFWENEDRTGIRNLRL